MRIERGSFSKHYETSEVISQPKAMALPPFESSRQDYSNEWSVQRI